MTTPSDSHPKHAAVDPFDPSPTPVGVAPAAPAAQGNQRSQIQIAVIAALVTAGVLVGGFFGWQQYTHHKTQQRIATLDAWVKQSMQAKFNTDSQFSKFGLQVEKVSLIKESDHKYSGIATVSTRVGTDHDVAIDITDDGDNSMWQAQPGAFMFLVQDQMSSILPTP